MMLYIIIVLNVTDIGYPTRVSKGAITNVESRFVYESRRRVVRFRGKSVRSSRTQWSVGVRLGRPCRRGCVSGTRYNK